MVLASNVYWGQSTRREPAGPLLWRGSMDLIQNGRRETNQKEDV
jgi:hypothetical protein